MSIPLCSFDPTVYYVALTALTVLLVIEQVLGWSKCLDNSISEYIWRKCCRQRKHTIIVIERATQTDYPKTPTALFAEAAPDYWSDGDPEVF